MKISQQIQMLNSKVNCAISVNDNNILMVQSINHQFAHIIEQVTNLEIYVEKLKLKENQNNGNQVPQV